MFFSQTDLMSIFINKLHINCSGHSYKLNGWKKGTILFNEALVFRYAWDKKFFWTFINRSCSHEEIKRRFQSLFLDQFTLVYSLMTLMFGIQKFSFNPAVTLTHGDGCLEVFAFSSNFLIKKAITSFTMTIEERSLLIYVMQVSERSFSLFEHFLIG